MESFIAKESSIKELEKKQAKQQQNNSFSVFFVKKILPWVYLWKANKYQFFMKVTELRDENGI